MLVAFGLSYHQHTQQLSPLLWFSVLEMDWHSFFPFSTKCDEIVGSVFDKSDNTEFGPSHIITIIIISSSSNWILFLIAWYCSCYSHLSSASCCIFT